MSPDLNDIIKTVSQECNHYQYSDNFPEPFIGTQAKVFFLGADPGTTHGERFRHVFKLEDGELSPYFRQFNQNLRTVKLSIEDLYVENLCRNYFTCDTLSHREHWLKCAKHWIEPLKSDFDKIDPGRTRPVLVSAYIVLEALCPWAMEQPEYYYINQRFIRSNQNRLSRTLIPFFRGGRGKYTLSNWKDYAEKISKAVAQNYA